MKETFELVKRLYKDELGRPLELKPGQLEIFDAIATKQVPGQEHTKVKRVQVVCHTRYGKSLAAGLGVLTRAISYPEKWAIVAGTKGKAKIIMDYVLAHISDNEYGRKRFRLEKGETFESIRRYRNKNHITFDMSDFGENLISEVYIVSAEDALGLGAANIVEDEAALINDDDHSLIMRMLGDNPHENFLLKIGNPFARNHFLKSHNDPAYHKIVIDCYRGLEEGRMTLETIEENRPYSFFKVLYECIFPGAEEMDESGWLYLVTDEDIKIAEERVLEPYGSPKLGVDVARGGRNYNVWVLRQNNYSKVLLKNKDNDLMSITAKTKELIDEYRVKPSEVFIDDTGVGGGVSDRLKELGYAITPVRLGERAEENEEYANVRAEVYAGKNGLMNWIKRTGKLEAHKDWIELTFVRYKKRSDGRVIIESKDDMRKRGIESPDVADALALTFANSKAKIPFVAPDPRSILDGAVKPYFPGIG